MILGNIAAKRIWGKEDPIGKRITFSDDPATEDWYTVIGVVEDVKQENLKQDTPAAIYQPLAQVQVPFFLEHMSYVLRTSAPLNVVEGLSRARLLEVDANQPLFKVASMQELLSASTAEPRFYSRVLVTFSVIALVLATLGIYGVIAYSVAQRTREIGIRMALGAKPANILGGVMTRSAVLVAGGLVLGIAGALATTRVLRSFLFEVTPTDAATFAALSALLAAVALAASYIPARRAMRIDPMVSLRYE
jgi:putative ABC transport system permease protein